MKYWFSKLGQTCWLHIVKYSVTDGNKGREAGRIIHESKEEQGGVVVVPTWNFQAGMSAAVFFSKGQGIARAKVCRTGLGKRLGRGEFHQTYVTFTPQVPPVLHFS